MANQEQKGPDRAPAPKAGDRVTCPHCGRTLVLVARLGLWACDPGTKRRHRCLDDRGRR